VTRSSADVVTSSVTTSVDPAPPVARHRDGAGSALPVAVESPWQSGGEADWGVCVCVCVCVKCREVLQLGGGTHGGWSEAAAKPKQLILAAYL